MSDPLRGWKIDSIEWHIDGHPIAIGLRDPKTKRTVRLAAPLPPPPAEVMEAFDKLDPMAKLIGGAVAETILRLRVTSEVRTRRQNEAFAEAALDHLKRRASKPDASNAEKKEDS